MRINIYAHLITIEILDEIYARAQNWSTVEYMYLRASQQAVWKFSKIVRYTYPGYDTDSTAVQLYRGTSPYLTSIQLYGCTAVH
jgi:hypothetical protein